MICQSLNDRYHIESLLGRQTGRRTYLAKDLQTKCSVVLKLMLFGPDFTWDDLKLFEREAEVLKSLDLPTIPKYLDCFEVTTPMGQGFVLVQTYIEAKSLQAWLNAGRTFSEDEVTSIADTLLEILNYLHSRHPAVIHRDIKPSNILLGDRSAHSVGQVYLVDFGSVQTMSAAQNNTFTIVGSYGYMPPEQFGGRTVASSDLYSLGMTLIYLLAGKHPADLQDVDEQTFSQAFASVSLPLRQWLLRMIKSSVSERFQSALIALQALKQPEQEVSSILKPHGSKISVIKGFEKIEIVLPGISLGFSEFLKSPSISSFFQLVLLNIVVAIFSNIATYTFILLGVSMFFSTFFKTIVMANGSLFPYIFLIISVFVYASCLFRIKNILRTVRFRIDSEHVGWVYELCGRKSSLKDSSPSKSISKIVKTPLYQKRVESTTDRGSTTISYEKICPTLVIFSGVKKYVLSNITEAELDWLSAELSDFLDMSLEHESLSQ
jgi:serine/threonine protein kinase